MCEFLEYAIPLLFIGHYYVNAGSMKRTIKDMITMIFRVVSLRGRKKKLV